MKKIIVKKNGKKISLLDETVINDSFDEVNDSLDAKLNFDSVDEFEIVVTYQDSTTETINLIKWSDD